MPSWLFSADAVKVTLCDEVLDLEPGSDVVVVRRKPDFTVKSGLRIRNRDLSGSVRMMVLNSATTPKLLAESANGKTGQIVVTERSSGKTLATGTHAWIGDCSGGPTTWQWRVDAAEVEAI